jgi:hypothetical protein
VSGTFKTRAPSSTAAAKTSHRKSTSLRVASSAENSTSAASVEASRTASRVIFKTSPRVFFSLCSRWMSEVATKVWMRGRAARLSARPARAMSCSEVRASAATVTARHSAAMAWTAAKSPSEAMGNPASITSTPSASSCRASRNFSSKFIEQPGDCSPSLSVVSKTAILSALIIH